MQHMKRFFNEIEEKTGYKFVYNTSEIDRNERTSIQGTSMDLNELLRNLLRSKRNISFRISNKHIALFKAQIKTIFRNGRRHTRRICHRS